MLYTLIIANLLAIAFSHDGHCNYQSNATTCLSDPTCGWIVSNNRGCGWCMDPGYECADAAEFNCQLKCQIADVPTYAKDSCQYPDDVDCGIQCETEILACQADTVCWQIVNATAYAEAQIANDEGCNSGDYDERERCKSKNQVFFKALNVSLSAYCWGDSNNDDSCALYKEAVSCYAHKCSDDCDDCSMACRDNFVDCVFDEKCSVALLWLTDEINDHENEGDLFFPYELKQEKDAYCEDSSTSENCNAEFEALWSCLVESCLEASCAYSQCNTKFAACYNDDECKEQLAAVTAKYPLEHITPGVGGSLIKYFCKKDSTLTCDNTNFMAMLECYSGKCCWAPDLCVGSDMLDGCDHPDCLEEACVEVKCLAQFRNCLDDVNCGDAFMLQIQWSEYCESCLESGKDATYCSNNTANVDCTVMQDSSAIFYLQYYCWKNPDKCDEDVSNLLKCVVQNCADCDDEEEGDNKDGTSGTGGDSGSSGSSSEIEEDQMCLCVFGTCWDSVSDCFFDENCWELLFGDNKDGYGFDSMMEAATEDVGERVLLVPSLLDRGIRQNYCKDKTCNSNFWNVWYCIWPPIYMGDDYSCSNYWKDMSTGCGLSDALYHNYPECLSEECLGLADDCLGDPISECTTTYTAAMSGNTTAELFLCDFCSTIGDCDDNCQRECESICVTTETLESNYTKRCGADGTACPQEYRNFANCLYRKCGDGTKNLPGTKITVLDCETEGGSGETSGVVMQTGILALVSVVLVVFTL